MHADGCHTRGLPEEFATREDGTIGAGEPVPPPVRIKLARHADADATALACAHPAGHRALDGDLDANVALRANIGNAFHHGFGAAGVEDEFAVLDTRFAIVEP